MIEQIIFNVGLVLQDEDKSFYVKFKNPERIKKIYVSTNNINDKIVQIELDNNDIEIKFWHYYCFNLGEGGYFITELIIDKIVYITPPEKNIKKENDVFDEAVDLFYKYFDIV